MGWKKGLLKREKEEPAYVAEKSNGTEPKNLPSTLFGTTVQVTGQIRSDEDMLVSGRIRGEIDCAKMIIVASGGSVEGSIRCKSIVISGSVEGDVVAEERVTIEASGRLRGDITTKILTHQPGGFFEGYSHMVEHPKPAPPKPAPPPPQEPPPPKKEKKQDRKLEQMELQEAPEILDEKEGTES